MLFEMIKKQSSVLALIALFCIVTLTASFSSAKFAERNEFSLKLAMAEHSTFAAEEEHLYDG